MKKHIRIRFVDFWDDFVPENNIFYQLLSEHYDVELSDTPDYLFCSVFQISSVVILISSFGS